jgi:hypothetical protein
MYELCTANIHIQLTPRKSSTKIDIRTNQFNSSNVDNYKVNETQFQSANVDRQTLFAFGYYFTSAAAFALFLPELRYFF